MDTAFWSATRLGSSGGAAAALAAGLTGLAREGLPIGVQIVGPQYGDFTTIRVAQWIERAYYAFVPPPAYA